MICLALTLKTKDIAATATMVQQSKRSVQCHAVFALVRRGHRRKHARRGLRAVRCAVRVAVAHAVAQDVRGAPGGPPRVVLSISCRSTGCAASTVRHACLHPERITIQILPIVVQTILRTLPRLQSARKRPRRWRWSQTTRHKVHAVQRLMARTAALVVLSVATLLGAPTAPGVVAAACGSTHRPSEAKQKRNRQIDRVLTIQSVGELQPRKSPPPPLLLVPPPFPPPPPPPPFPLPLPLPPPPPS